MKTFVANVNSEAIAQAALAFIITNNRAVQTAGGAEVHAQYIDGQFSMVEAMQFEFLRWVSNTTQEHSLDQLTGSQAIAIAQLVYTCVTRLDTEVLAL